MRTPLVLLPGMMCDERLFAPQMEKLADVAECWVGDIGGIDTIELLAAAILRDAPFPRFALCGLSMGGIVAMQVVAQAPDRVTHLALLDTNHLPEPPERQALRGPQIERVRAGFLREVLVEDMKPNYLGPAHRGDVALLDSILAMGLDLGPEVFERQSRALRDRPDATEALRAYAGPSLVLCGRHDGLCPVSRHETMASLLPNAALVIVEGAGHLSTLEEPQEVTAALRAWLASSPGGPVTA